MKRRGTLVMATALLIAAVGTGCGALKRLEYAGVGRDWWQHTDEVIRALDLKPGDRVADLGAGGGYFTFPLAQAVGPSGAVYAVDIDPDMTEYVQRRAAEDGIPQIHTILAAPDDPRLPADGVDLLFTSNTYHHLQDRPAYFARVKRCLRAGGRVAILDFDGRGFITWLFGHTAATDMVRNEMQAAGYQLQREHGFLRTQSFLVFVDANSLQQ